MSIHASHRQRVKDRFRAEGLDSFDEVHALELLLFYAIPQGDVNPLAHRLLDRFGNLRQVLEAPTEHLLAVEGVGPHTAMLLSLVKGLARQYLITPEGKSTPMKTLEECGNYLRDRLLGRRDETVMLLCLDAKRKLLGCRIISEGSVNSAEVSTRKVMDAALAMNATSVVLAHNHPSGIALPSMEDVVTTRRMAMALDAVGILLEDHIVVADRDYVSLFQSGYYDPDQCRMMV